MVLLYNTLVGLGFLAITAIYMYIAKKLSDKVAGYDPNYLIEEESNLAVGLRRAGFYLAIPLGMYGAIRGPSLGYKYDLIAVALSGVAMLLFLFIARIVNDKLLLPGIKNSTEIKNDNVAVGLVEFGSYIATGFIAQASLHGVGSAASALVFFVLGQVVLSLVVRLYELVTPWNVLECVKKNNKAAGLMLAGILIALSIAIYGAIAGDMTNWTYDLSYFGIASLVSIVVLSLSDKLISPFFLPGTTIQTEIVRDDNPSAILVVVAIKIAIALIINSIML